MDHKLGYLINSYGSYMGMSVLGLKEGSGGI